MSVPDAAALRAVAGELLDADHVTILSHVRPDADSIGSGLALKIALERVGVTVEFGVPGRWGMSQSMDWMPQAASVLPASKLVGYSTVVAVDCASPGRLGEGLTTFERAKFSAVLDHHASNKGFGTIAIINDNADSCAEVVLDLLDAADLPVDIDIAECVYAGLVTDTESFRSSRPRSFEIAARLLALGVDGQLVARRLLDARPFTWLQMLSKVLHEAQMVREVAGGAGLIYAVVPLDFASNVAWEDTETVIDVVTSVNEAEIAAVLKETSPGHWSVSLRSRGITDVSAVASSFGGGGHRSKAGYVDIGASLEVCERLIRSLV